MTRLQVSHIAWTFNVHWSLNKNVTIKEDNLIFLSSTQISPEDGDISLKKALAEEKNNVPLTSSGKE